MSEKLDMIKIQISRSFEANLDTQTDRQTVTQQVLEMLVHLKSPSFSTKGTTKFLDQLRNSFPSFDILIKIMHYSLHKICSQDFIKLVKMAHGTAYSTKFCRPEIVNVFSLGANVKARVGL